MPLSLCTPSNLHPSGPSSPLLSLLSPGRNDVCLPLHSRPLLLGRYRCFIARAGPLSSFPPARLSHLVSGRTLYKALSFLHVPPSPPLSLETQGRVPSPLQVELEVEAVSRPCRSSPRLPAPPPAAAAASGAAPDAPSSAPPPPPYHCRVGGCGHRPPPRDPRRSHHA